MKVAGYVRVSTSAQTDAYGLEAQRADIERYCASHGHEIIAWYEDKGVSGVKESRPELDKLLYRVGNPPVEGVVVAASDRIAREIELYYAIKHQMSTRGMQLISVREDFGYKGAYAPVLEALMAAMAEIERGAIKQRTTAGRMVKASSGGYAGGKPPFGYKVVNKELEIEESEASVVREVYDLYKRGIKVAEIARIMEKEGRVCRSGSPVSVSVVRNILNHRKFYEGYYCYGNGIWVQGKHEPLC